MRGTRFLVRIAIMAMTAGLAGFVAACTAAAPANYPSKPVELVVPFPAGGGIDLPARVLAEFLANTWGQPVNVVNKPGGNGVTGTQSVMSAAADGYTLLIDSPGSSSLQVASLDDVPYKLEDRTYIAKFATLPMTYVVTADLPWKTLQDVQAAIKADPASFSWASVGSSTVADFAMYQFFDAAGIDPAGLKKVAFQGGPPGLTAVAGGHVQIMSSSVGSSLPLVQSGQLRSVGVIMPQRTNVLPDVSTVGEQKFSQITASAWDGVSGPAGVPESVQQAWATALQKIMKDPAYIERMEKLSISVVFEDAATFRTATLKERDDAVKYLRGH